MPRTTQTEARLKAASDHLQYEYSMFIALTQALGSGIAEKGWLLNALLESWVVHFRALLDFAYPTQAAKADDVIAADYFDSANAWEAFRPSMSDLLSRGRERANKEIVHLSYVRIDVTPQAKQWQFAAISVEIAQLMNAFLTNVPKNRLGPRWSNDEDSVA